VRKRLGDSLVCLYREEAGQGLIEYVLISGAHYFCSGGCNAIIGRRFE